MAEVRKVLGQAAPAATTNSTLYTVPAATEAVVSTVSVCNREDAPATFRLAVRPAGAAIADQHYVVYDAVIKANDSVFMTIGLTLAATDVVTVYASSALLTFSLFGAEVS